MKGTVAFLVFLINVCLALHWNPSAVRHTKKMAGNEKHAPITDDLVERINKRSGFRAKKYGKFAGLTRDQMRRFLGTHADPAWLKRSKREAEETLTVEAAAALPDTFNVWGKWPVCANFTKYIQDQGNCAASWAVATTSAIDDRVCITYNETRPRRSAWDLLSCCGQLCLQFGGNGCDGYSHPIYGTMWYIENGIVTGSVYGGKYCKPFPIAPDNSDPINDTTCTQSCQASYTSRTYQKDLVKGRAFSVRSNSTLVRNDLYKNGPVIATFEVYDDFYAYESGVYSYTEGDFVGVQSVRIVGWGETAAGVKYWRAANSWGSDWGEGGFFRIQRDVNECDIESYVVSPVVT